jgi:hypothetical protein
LRESLEPYDKRVAGVTSGAGGYRPTLVLDKRPSERRRVGIMAEPAGRIDSLQCGGLASLRTRLSG